PARASDGPSAFRLRSWCLPSRGGARDRSSGPAVEHVGDDRPQEADGGPGGQMAERLLEGGNGRAGDSGGVGVGELDAAVVVDQRADLADQLRGPLMALER